MKKLSILRTIPFIAIGLILFTNIFFPGITKFQPQYLLFNLLLLLISLIAVIMLFYNQGIKKSTIILLILGVAGTFTLCYLQYIKE
jgi:hypothetical protein